MKNFLLLAFLLVAKVGAAQNLELRQLLSIQKQEFNATNSFFIDSKWMVTDTSPEDEKGEYSVTWKKRASATSQAMCWIVFSPPGEEAKKENESFNSVNYVFSSKELYNRIRLGLGNAGYRPEKPVFINKIALSAYSNGKTVVLLGTNGEAPIGYVVKVMNYFSYALHYTDRLDYLKK